MTIEKFNSRASLDRSPGKNWVENAGGLPMMIRRIANHVHRKGKTIGHSIAIAVNAAKKGCASGDLNFKGKQSMNAKSRAEYCAAVAQWEAKKARARVSKGELGRKWSDEEFIEHLTGEKIESIEKCGKEKPDCGCSPAKKKRVAMKEKKAGRREELAKNKMPSDMHVHEGLSVATKKKKKKKKVVANKPAVEITDGEFDELLKSLDEFLDPDNPDTQDFSVEGEIEKRDDEKQMVFGWCSIAKDKDGNEIVDKQGDVLDDIDQMENVAYDFVLHSRDGGEMHVRKGVSTLVESFVSTPEKWAAMGIPEGTLPVGWWVGFKVNDQKVWRDVKIGKYRMFSVHGTGSRKSYDEGEGRSGTRKAYDE